MDTPVQLLKSLVDECQREADVARVRSRRHYFISYALMVLSLLGSIGAAVLAFWDGVDRMIVGLVALLPAVSATIAGQLRLIERGYAHVQHKQSMQILARDLNLASLRKPDWDVVAEANRRFNQLNQQFTEEWRSSLAFRFQSREQGAPATAESGALGD